MTWTLNINVQIGLDHDLSKLVNGLASKILSNETKIIANEEKIMNTLDDVTAEMTTQTTAVASLGVFIQGLKDQISALPGLTAAQQTQIQTIFDGLVANDSTIAAALVANVPPTPEQAKLPPVPVQGY